MKPLPILNPPTLHERIPLPRGKGITIPDHRRNTLTIAANPTGAELTKVQHGDMFINPETGYCVERTEKGFAPVTPAVIEALSRWMASNHPDLNAQINWDEQPNWRP